MNCEEKIFTSDPVKRSTSWIAVLPALVIPICIGMMLYIGMLALIQHDIITNETVLRYLTGHPVSKITLAMFFVGCASLLMIGTNVFEQFGAAKKIQLDAPVETTAGSESHESDIKSNQEVDRAVGYAKSMLQLPRWMHDHYLWQRIVNALHSVYRTGAATGIEDEMKYLAELDFDRQQQRYSLVRILIWATPMLGFLGTVLGISQALGGINVGPENDFQQMMDGLRGSLYVAFDTTALALTLSMILMFGQFLVDRFESQLLSLVDQRARVVIAGKFNLSLSQPEISLEKISGEVVTAMKQAVDAQTEVWRKTIRSAEQAWASSLSDVGGVVQEQLSVAIDESVAELGRYLGNTI
jgi:biopolymer transport protein ExbB/TolQ